MSKLLLKAAAFGKVDEVTALLGEGADVNFADKKTGRTALIEAAIGAQEETTRLLINQGAILDICDFIVGETALGWATSGGHLAIVKHLVNAGANVDLTKNQLKLTPLMVATQSAHLDIVAELISAGADLKLLTGDGRNVLSIAQERRRIAIADLLLKNGAQLPSPVSESLMPWPESDSDASKAQNADPITVLRNFILAMNLWELDCAQHKRDKGTGHIDFAMLQARQDAIFQQFCTTKPRPQGRLGSFSTPPTYDPSETLVSEERNGKRAVLITRRAASGSLQYEVQYILLKKQNLWRVDGNKIRIYGTQTWRVSIL